MIDIIFAIPYFILVFWMLGKIRFAKKRILEGEYGACISCGVPIGYRRLLVRPGATMCIDCKTEQEQLERGTWAI